jgi:Family of unknown function (DUF6460)
MNMEPDALTRFLGGKPSSVAIRLLIISVIVGALLYWAGLTPFSLINGIRAMVENLIGTGWDAVRNVAEFAIYGAVIVIPLWLIARLLSNRKA